MNTYPVGPFTTNREEPDYLAVLKDAGEKLPLLLVVLGSPPPVLVQGHERFDLPTQ